MSARITVKASARSARTRRISVGSGGSYGGDRYCTLGLRRAERLLRLCANDFGNMASMDVPIPVDLFWYPNPFWYTPTRNWLVEASIASILPLMWWGLLPALP